MSAVAPQTESRSHPVVVLIDARTDIERELITAWAHREHPGQTLVHRGDGMLGTRLERDDDPLVVPVRVTWLPPERDGDRRVRASDLIVLANPRRPHRFAQRLLVRTSPDRARVTVGEGAHVRDLRRRFEADAGSGQGRDDFAAFVARQATLACERAERQLIGDRYKVPRLVAEQIAASGRFREKVRKLAQRLDRPFDDVMADADAALREVATVQSRLATDVFRMVMSPLHARAWTVRADSSGLERLREVNRKHALVFLPTHRSYVDPLVLAEVLHDHDFPRNHVLGGANMSFWPIGPLGRRAGMIFIRRQFGDDAVYKLAVSEVLGHLIAKRFNLEWYIEGGRTRTGKLRPPKFGLLRYLVKALEDGRTDDVMLVPTAIIYDHQTEVGAIAAEHTGGKKKAEGLGWFADYARAQRENVGGAQVTFGDPISLRQALEDAGEGAAQLEKVAFRICDGINRVTPVSGPSLATFTLLGSRDRALTFDQVARATAPLLDLLERRGVPGPIAALRRPSGLRDALDSLVEAGVATVYKGGSEPVWSIAPGAAYVAAFYRNAGVHHLVNRAIVELALLKIAGESVAGDPIDAAWEDALGLRDLLKFEFFFADKRRFRDELEVELELIAPDWATRARSRGEAANLVAGERTLVAHRALRSFLDAMLVVARLLAERDPRHAYDRQAFIDEALGVGRQLLLQGVLHSEDSVSAELFGSALKQAGNRDLLDPGREEVRQARDAWLAEIEDVLERVSRIGALDAALLEEVLDGDRR